MGVYIKGMEMPVFEHQSWDIRKGADGKWYMVDTNAETSDGAWHEVVHVPPHGRLIDADALEQNAQKRLLMCNRNDNQFQKPYEVMRAITLAPTIIPAEEGET